MSSWALTLYYFIFFLVPWGPLHGHEVVWNWALTKGGWTTYLAVIAGSILGLGAACGLAGAALRKDDQRWDSVLGSIGRFGWLSYVDGIIPFFGAVLLGYSLWNGLPLQGMAAALVPLLIIPLEKLLLRIFNKGGGERKAEEEQPSEEDAEKPLWPEDIPLDSLIEDGRRHAGQVALRDTFSHSVVFYPPKFGIAQISDPEPYVVTWIVGREEAVLAKTEAFSGSFSECSDRSLAAIIEKSARCRTVSFLAEQISGADNLSAEDKVVRLKRFAEKHLVMKEESEPIVAGAPPAEVRPRLPITCLVERKAEDDEAQVLILAMALSLGLAVSIWRSDGSFGLAMEGVPQAIEGMEGTEYALGSRLYHMVGMFGQPSSIVNLEAPFRREKEVELPPL